VPLFYPKLFATVLVMAEVSLLDICQLYVHIFCLNVSLFLNISKIDDPGDHSERSHSEKVDFANFKRQVYHKVCEVIFSCLQLLARSGAPMTCGDDIVRILRTGIPIDALDGEESTWLAACRVALANFPCPRCLVHKDELHEIDKSFTPRTVENMRNVYHKSLTASSKTVAEDILRDYGLHATQVRHDVKIISTVDFMLTIVILLL
jgi:Plavaka transposase